MKDKEKHIEEMANKLNELFIPYIGYTNDFMCLEMAQELLKYYQPNISKDNIVLTREEYERLLVCEHNLNIGRESYRRMEERAYKTIEELNQELANVRKKTVREILTEIQAEIFKYLGVKSIKEADNLSLLGSLITYDLITDKLHELAHQYDVEIGE